MKQRAGAIVLGVTCLVIGATLQRAYDAWRASASREAQASKAAVETAALAPAPPWTPDPVDRSKVDHSKQPLWAWGESEPPEPGTEQAVQGPPRADALAAPLTEEQTRKRRIDGSNVEYSLAEIRTSGGFVVDWFSEDHPNPMPDIIRRGPAALGKDARPCGWCHLSDGSGRPENAAPAGLPAGYILRTLQDFKDGLHHNADPRKGNSNTMVMLAKAMSDEEMRQAADYFSAVTWRPHVRVVETKLVPKTKVQGELFIPQAKELTEPIGSRILEVPADIEGNQTLRNSRGTWIAYVPVGAIKKGKDLVTTGGMTVVNGQIIQGKTTACGTCHGQDLLGVAPDVPPLAGRSPNYLAREIFDIQQGTRTGSNSNLALMKMVVEKLTPEDMLNITAYLASLPVAKTPGGPVTSGVSSN